MSRADIPDTDTSSDDNGGREQFQPRECQCDHCRSQGYYPAGPECRFEP